MPVVKHSVKADGLLPSMYYAWGVADAIAGFLCEHRNVVTSALDSKHGEKSLHYTGRALDFRISHFSPTQVKHFYSSLKSALDPWGFDVILESDHVHCEFDPKAHESLIERLPPNAP